MATFTNQATLSYNGGSTNSNIITGEIIEVLTVSKTAVVDTYRTPDKITYVISLINSGTTTLTGLSLTDNLGAYAVGNTTVYPLTYIPDSIRYYTNGTLVDRSGCRCCSSADTHWNLRSSGWKCYYYI